MMREMLTLIIIKLIRLCAYSLEQLLAQITADNQHDAVDFGKAVGKEAF